MFEPQFSYANEMMEMLVSFAREYSAAKLFEVAVANFPALLRSPGKQMQLELLLAADVFANHAESCLDSVGEAA